jgi:20S proteasome alpha/beta subunit
VVIQNRKHFHGVRSRKKCERRINRQFRRESLSLDSSPLFGRRGGGDGGLSSLSSASASSSISSSNTIKSSIDPYEYTPITALNDYGRSDQLQYASISSSKFGVPIVACICSTKQQLQQQGHHHHHHDAIIVCSLQRCHRQDGVIPTTNVATGGGVGLVRQLVTRDDVDAATDCNIDDIDDDDESSSITNQIKKDAGSATTMVTKMQRMSRNNPPCTLLHTAMVVSGIRSDADYLSDRLRSHAVKHWFRYDTSPSLNTMAEMVRDIMLDFLGYDRGEEVRSAQVSGGIGSAAPSYNGGGSGGGEDDEDGNYGGENSRAGRPLGVSVFLLEGLDSILSREGDGVGAKITSIEADGSSRTYVARAMGMGSQVVNEKLSHRWRKNMSIDEAIDMMRSTMKDVARDVGWLYQSGDEADRLDDYEEDQLAVVCEIVTLNGIDVHSLTI